MPALATKFAPEGTAFDRAVQAGIRNAELWTSAAVLSRGEEVAALANRYPLAYAVHFPNGLSLPEEAPAQMARLCQQVGARVVVMHEPSYERYGAALTQADPTLTIAVENHLLDLDGLEAWAMRHASLTLDVEHLWRFTFRDGPLHDVILYLAWFWVRFGGKVAHVHLPGYWPGEDEHRPLHASPVFVREVVGTLTRLGYQGMVVSEADQRYQTREDLSRDVALWDKIAAPPMVAL